MGYPLFSTCFWVLCQLLSHLPSGGTQTVTCGSQSCSSSSCCLGYPGTGGLVCGCPPGLVPTPQNSSITCQKPPCSVPILKKAKEECGDPQAASRSPSCTQTIQSFLQQSCSSPTRDTLQTLLPELQKEADNPKALDLLLKGTEVLVLSAALGGLGTQTIHTPTMEAKVEVVGDNCSGKVLELEVAGQRLTIDCSQVVDGSEGDTPAVAFIVYREVEEALRNVTRMGQGQEIVSEVVGGSLANGTLRGNFTLTLGHKKVAQAGEELLCVSWELNGTQGLWTPHGCHRTGGGDNHSTCTCNHFTTFAVLMAPRPQEKEASLALTVVTYVGVSVSLVCLFLTILTFLLCRSLWSVSVALHLQLSLCLFAANLLFLLAVWRTSNQLACTITAAFLHYLFLASFSWMFLEGLHLFLTVRNLRVLNYTSTRSFRKRWIYPVGYGLPALVVAISATIHPGGYGTKSFCWLSTEGGFIWSFLGPICTIILVNLLFFLITLWTLRHRLSSLNADVTAIKNTRMMTFKALMHVCILGCTWGVGLLQTRGDNEVVAFIFTILNTLQGAFIFLVHCVLNRQVTEQYWRWFRALRRQAHPQEMPTTEMNITYTTEGDRPQTQGAEGCAWEK